MCEKVDQLVRQVELQNLFIYVQDGGMALSKAARRADLSTKEFKEQMQRNGYLVPQRTRRTSVAK